MRKALIFIGLSVLVLITACNSTGAKEVLEYHNAYYNEIVEGVMEIDEAYVKMELTETVDEDVEIANNEILPTLDKMKTHMESQKPTKDDTKEYHKLRSDWFELYSELVESEIQMMDDYMNDLISEEELEEKLVESFARYEEMEELWEKGETKIDELADKYKFEEDEVEE